MKQHRVSTLSVNELDRVQRSRLQQHMRHDELACTAGVSNAFVTAILAFRWPMHFWLWHLVKTFVLVPWRYVRFKATKSELYLLDWCYVVSWLINGLALFAVLVNGADGIGTGWSTSIPNYNPRDLMANIRRLLADEEQERMHPWYRNFEGEIMEEVVKGEVRYHIKGKYEIQDETTLVITELPLRSWTTDYKEFLEGMMNPKEKNATPFITDYKEHHTDTTVSFTVKMTEGGCRKAHSTGLHKFFKMTTSCTTSNMHLFNAQGQIVKYDNPEQIMREFYELRLEHYAKRKDYMVGEVICTGA